MSKVHSASFFLKKANKRNFFRLFFLNKEKYLRYLHSKV